MGESLQTLGSESPRKDWKEVLGITTDVKKQEELIMLISEKMSRKINFGKTVLAKMMYFSESNCFLQNGKTIAGTVFVKGEYGPIPKNFNDILNKMQTEGLIKMFTMKEVYDRTTIMPLRESNPSVFTAEELAIINDVIGRMNVFTAVQMKDYSHEDVAWKWTEDGQEIDYRLAVYRDIQTM
jgi:uncharacterized phage-associated protein